MVLKPDPTTDPVLRFCDLLTGWLAGRRNGLSKKGLIERLQDIFIGSGITGPHRIIQEMRRRSLPGDYWNLKYRFTSVGPELDETSLRKILKRFSQRPQGHSGNSAESGSHRTEERQCVDTNTT